jgi:hypothetical protein
VYGHGSLEVVVDGAVADGSAGHVSASVEVDGVASKLAELTALGYLDWIRR